MIEILNIVKDEIMQIISSSLNFLNTNSSAIQAIATIVLVIITGVYVWFTRKTVQIMKKSEDERRRSHVILYIQQREDWLNFVDLIVGNYGIDVARDIEFTLNEDLQLLKEGEMLSNIGIIKNGIKNLVPQQILKIPLLSLVGRVEELQKKNIIVTITYKNSAEMKKFKEDFPLDFHSLVEHQIGEPPMYKISKNIESIAKVLDKFRMYKQESRIREMKTKNNIKKDD